MTQINLTAKQVDILLAAAQARVQAKQVAQDADARFSGLVNIVLAGHDVPDGVQVSFNPETSTLEYEDLTEDA